jgi:hypothetical protein
MKYEPWLQGVDLPGCALIELVNKRLEVEEYSSSS